MYFRYFHLIAQPRGLIFKKEKPQQNDITRKIHVLWNIIFISWRRIYSCVSENESMKLHNGRKPPVFPVLCAAEEQHTENFSSAPELPKGKISFTYRCPSCMSWWRSTARWHKLLLCPAPGEAPSEWKPGEQKAEPEGKQSVLEDVAATTIITTAEKELQLHYFLV